MADTVQMYMFLEFLSQYDEQRDVLADISRSSQLSANQADVYDSPTHTEFGNEQNFPILSTSNANEQVIRLRTAHRRRHSLDISNIRREEMRNTEHNYSQPMSSVGTMNTNSNHSLPDSSHTRRSEDNTQDCLTETPSKQPLDEMKGLRKRLLMTPDDDHKRICVRRQSCPTPSTQQLAVYSKHQLVQCIQDLATSHTHIKQEIQQSLGTPDITPLLNHLEHLQRNVLKALPKKRYFSFRDAFAYHSVKSHLIAYKNACLEQGRTISRAEQWYTLCRYCCTASRYTNRLPVWDDPLHNKLRNACFKILGSLCEQAVKHICDNDTQAANTDPEVDGNNNAMDVEDGNSSDVKVHQSGKELAQLKARLQSAVLWSSQMQASLHVLQQYLDNNAES